MKILPTDSIFLTQKKFQQDTRSNKINAALGVILKDQKNALIPSVQSLLDSRNETPHEYLSMEGDMEFLTKTAQYYLAEYYDADHTAHQQIVGGTQGIWLLNRMAEILPAPSFLISLPTWGNYFAILENNKIVQFNHFDENKKVCFQNYEKALSEAETGSILILQATDAHNPTGKNLSPTERKKLIALANQKNIWIYLDAAYIGLGAGVSNDKKWIQEFWQKSEKIMLGVSFSKTATLYGHRTGAFFMKCQNIAEKEAVESQLQATIRQSISNPPRWGSDIVKELITKNTESWEKDITTTQEDLVKTRENLKKIIQEYPNTEDLIEALEGQGLFAQLPISPEKILEVRKKHSLYICDNGRINISGFIGREEAIQFLME